MFKGALQRKQKFIQKTRILQIMSKEMGQKFKQKSEGVFGLATL